MKVLRTRFKLLRSRVYPLARAVHLLRRKAWTCFAGDLLRRAWVWLFCGLWDLVVCEWFCRDGVIA